MYIKERTGGKAYNAPVLGKASPVTGIDDGDTEVPSMGLLHFCAPSIE